MIRYEVGQYGEPWTGDEVSDFLKTRDGGEVAEVSDPEISGRIEGCVNACNGLDPAALPEFVEAAKAVFKAWDTGHEFCNDGDVSDAVRSLESAARKLGVMGEGKQ